MKKLLGVFAHPDDETFGPGGSIAQWVQEGVEVRLLVATRGQAGVNPFAEDTAVVRERELKAAARELGVTEVQCLDFMDGTLCNQSLPELEKSITEVVEDFKPDALLTFDLNGMTGHIDHMVVSSAVHHVFQRSSIPQQLYVFTLPLHYTQTISDYFVYFPAGEPAENIDICRDVKEVTDVRLRAMQQHESQLATFGNLEDQLVQTDFKEYFWLLEK